MHLAILFLSKILSINITPRNSFIGVNGQGCISNLDWQSIFKIKQTHLANIFEFTACLANFSFLVPCITAWSPPENCKWSGANFTLFVKICLRLHPKKIHLNLIPPHMSVFLQAIYKYTFHIVHKR